jgi:hypothetical protein
MPRKNLLSLHEAIVIALINQPTRSANFEEIAKFIEERKLYPERKGNIPLATQVMLRSTKANGAYHDLFEEVGTNQIRLREIASQNFEQLNNKIIELENTIKRLNFQRGIDKAIMSLHGENFTSAAADLLINPNPVKIHGTEKGMGFDFMISAKDVIAIESKKRIKRIYLKQSVIPIEGGKPKIIIETNESFEALLKDLQGNGHHILRASDKYAVNIYHYELSEKGKFNLIADAPKKIIEKIKTIKTEKRFDRKLYHTRLMEIDRLSKHHHDFSVNLKKIDEINRYKNL